MTPRLTVVLSQELAGKHPWIDSASKTLASQSRFRVLTVPHLYHAAADGETAQTLRDVQGDLIAVAPLYPRPTYWLLDALGVGGRWGDGPHSPHEKPQDAAEATAAASPARPTPNRTIWCLDLRTFDTADAFLAAVERIAATTGQGGGPAKQDEPPTPARRPNRGDEPRRTIDEPVDARWYPVVDFDRCVGCLECLNFCLFGVYGLGESGGVLVEQPDACRDGCPACSRVCARGAIMFPLYHDPVIAGAPSSASESAASGDAGDEATDAAKNAASRRRAQRASRAAATEQAAKERRKAQRAAKQSTAKSAKQSTAKSAKPAAKKSAKKKSSTTVKKKSPAKSGKKPAKKSAKSATKNAKSSQKPKKKPAGKKRTAPPRGRTASKASAGGNAGPAASSRALDRLVDEIDDLAF